MTEEKQYVYIFTRQDISPEQQLVQSAHATLKLGVYSANTEIINPNETYFTVVGVRNRLALEATKELLDDYEFRYVEFNEPDLGGEITSIATYPIPECERGVLLSFSWLRF